VGTAGTGTNQNVVRTGPAISATHRSFAGRDEHRDPRAAWARNPGASL